MAEHTPSPSPSRGVYGFALYLIFTCSFGIYIIWAGLPDSVLQSSGISYYPQKYWAIALPVYCMMGLAIFAFFIYPCFNLLLTPPLDSMKTITDSYSFYQKLPKEGCILSCSDMRKSNVHGIPSASDLSISEVCKTLYLGSN